MEWSADGKHLRYQQADKLFDVAVRDVGDKLEISAPTELMTLPADSVVIAILPDGKRTPRGPLHVGPVLQFAGPCPQLAGPTALIVLCGPLCPLW
jgi:hypothetical protein